ncbi:MAG: SMC-Scp complex subunit ScpB [Candidatus Ryanbacteria bacterium CG10_big_fil_rev_8_21_14_0_10_43_42]|uniref:SMC-Scp complex subunit ScpB n=1 Tax=Candidatus Ryanbacteria bacterium CG10_big_fil_rev_8_21_14_0_10_43_42 TaxID=1974864 RepID=A0A2M8KW34_9BACT|nr:MAG: SMC-Scp complex subunit ScpB [Candidatus Ryanbacteria bacterium CG10_big_fil_rev_8_21_14_0_10_43_42]
MHSHQDISELARIIEALLFVSGDPVSHKKLAAITKKDETTVVQACTELERMLEIRGLRILTKDNHVSLVTAPHYASYIEELIKAELWGDMSKAALETLTIIAYRHPISRPEIDYIRGVNSAFTLRNLLTRGLVERIHIKQDVRTYHYRPTVDFMKFLGLASFADLPEYETYRQELEAHTIAPQA